MEILIIPVLGHEKPLRQTLQWISSAGRYNGGSQYGKNTSVVASGCPSDPKPPQINTVPSKRRVEV